MSSIIIGALTSAAATVTTGMINDFKQHFEGEQKWECWPDEAIENWKLIETERKNDNFPQGKDKILKILGYAYKNRVKFYVKANKKWPNWTWYYSLTD